MTIVFLSGSRAISRINDAIRRRIDNMIEKGLEVIVGDANGADKAIQRYLARRLYDRVTVYCVGGHCRNNIGNWPVQLVDAGSKLSGWEYYAQKDKEMARIASFGLVLWDGKSSGSVHNIFELLKDYKKVVVYYAPEKEFYSLSSHQDALALLAKSDPETIDGISKKIGLSTYLKERKAARQVSFSFH